MFLCLAFFSGAHAKTLIGNRGVARIFRGGFLAVAREARAKNLTTTPTFRPRALINDRHFQREFA